MLPSNNKNPIGTQTSSLISNSSSYSMTSAVTTSNLWAGHIATEIATSQIPSTRSTGKVMNLVAGAVVSFIANRPQPVQNNKNNTLGHITQRFGLSGVCCHPN